MAKLIAFGDSWTIGDCTDLIKEQIVSSDDDNVINYDGDGWWVFKTPWPNLVANRLGLDILNFGISGNCNKAIITQLYDYHLFHGFDKNDIVIVSLSTWHRSYYWKTDVAARSNELIFKDTSCKYGSVSPRHLQGSVVIDNYDKIAYDAFFDFYTIKNYLENIGVKYYIGWAFTEVRDFSKYINSAYTREILETQNLLEPFFKFCKVINFEKLLHPTLEDHANYADYIYDRMKEDGL